MHCKGKLGEQDQMICEIFLSIYLFKPKPVRRMSKCVLKSIKVGSDREDVIIKNLSSIIIFLHTYLF